MHQRALSAARGAHHRKKASTRDVEVDTTKRLDPALGEVVGLGDTATGNARLCGFHNPAFVVPAFEIPAFEIPAFEIPASEIPASSASR
jgi:hypothetical protein